ncbi:ATP-binding protein [Mesorhizobium sp. C386A]|nr:hypothetical protein X752_21345 [Mesorhizobium sp. LNJC398B00]
MAGVGTLTIETSDVPDDIDDVHSLAGSCVRMTVRDAGCGMNKEILAQVFEPFFTRFMASSNNPAGTFGSRAKLVKEQASIFFCRVCRSSNQALPGSLCIGYGGSDVASPPKQSRRAT